MNFVLPGKEQWRHDVWRYFTSVPDLPDIVYFEFNELAKASPDSKLIEDFRNFIKKTAFIDLDDRELVFQRLFRKEGVTLNEMSYVVPEVLQKDKIVVLPYIGIHGYLKSAYLPMMDPNDENEERTLVMDWLSKNGDKYAFDMSNARYVDKVVRERKIQEFSALEIQNNGDKKLLGNFETRDDAEKFAEDHALSNGVKVAISATEIQVVKPRKTSSAGKLKISYRSLEHSSVSESTFVFVGENLRG